MMMLPVVLDAFVAVLLVATMVACWRLDRRLVSLRSEKAQLADLMSDFGQAAAKADQGLKALRLAAGEVGRDVEALVAKGQGLRDDLNYLIERGEPIADRLADAVRSRTMPVAPQPAVTAAPAPAPTAAPAVAARVAAAPRPAAPRAETRSIADAEPRSEIEQELLKALAALR